VNDVLFEESTTIKMGATDEKSKILFWTDQSKKKDYKTPLTVDHSLSIWAQAVGGGFVPSDTSFVEVLKLPKYKIKTINSERQLNDKYGGEGLDVLIDRKKGDLDFNQGWLGYLGDTISIDVEFDNREVHQIVISTLRNHGAWIFNPQEINVFKGRMHIATSASIDTCCAAGSSHVFTEISFEGITTDKLTIQMIAPKEIPSGHPGAGSKPWIFIDEILIY
jgi:hypothetical protein